MRNVMMLHSIGMQSRGLPYSFLSMPAEHFEQLCKYIDGKRIVTKFLKQWSQGDKALYITFDDGYLDNWTIAAPIAAKYGVKLTIFVNPEFVSEDQQVRPQYDGSNLVEITRISHGYLNWLELKTMVDRGMVDIQSHSMTHTRYSTSGTVIDLMDANNEKKYPWLAWNLNTLGKATYLDRSICDGQTVLPVFQYGRALGVRKYNHNDDVLMEIYTYCSAISNKMSIADRVKSINDYIYRNKLFGTIESDSEMHSRYWYELSESKRVLEHRLNIPITIIAWPGGAYNEYSIRVSREVGYTASTVSSRGDADPLAWNDYVRIPRFGVSSLLHTRKKQMYHKKMPETIVVRHLFDHRTMRSFWFSLLKRIL